MQVTVTRKDLDDEEGRSAVVDRIVASRESASRFRDAHALLSVFETGAIPSTAASAWHRLCHAVAAEGTDDDCCVLGQSDVLLVDDSKSKARGKGTHAGASGCVILRPCLIFLERDRHTS